MKSDLRWTGPNGVVHIVLDDPFRPVTLCGNFEFKPASIWKIKPGDHHEICITCRRRNEATAAELNAMQAEK